MLIRNKADEMRELSIRANKEVTNSMYEAALLYIRKYAGKGLRSCYFTPALEDAIVDLLTADGFTVVNFEESDYFHRNVRYTKVYW